MSDNIWNIISKVTVDSHILLQLHIGLISTFHLMCLHPAGGERVEKVGEWESEDVNDEESLNGDKYVDLPVLRGRQLDLSGPSPSWRDYRGDHANTGGLGDLSLLGDRIGERKRKVAKGKRAVLKGARSVDKGERRCVEKVMLVTETVYDTVIQCHHSYHKRCHTTYVTGK